VDKFESEFRSATQKHNRARSVDSLDAVNLAYSQLVMARTNLTFREAGKLSGDAWIEANDARKKAKDVEALANEAKSRAQIVKEALLAHGGACALTSAKVAAVDSGVDVLFAELELANVVVRQAVTKWVLLSARATALDPLPVGETDLRVIADIGKAEVLLASVEQLMAETEQVVASAKSERDARVRAVLQLQHEQKNQTTTAAKREKRRVKQ
jgi:hypothetical protein